MNSFAVLTYHSLDTSGSVVSVAPETFSAQISALEETGFRSISLREAMAYRKAHNGWPERCVALTFDDGFANFHKFAMPALVRRGFTATVFVISTHVGGGNDWEPPPNRLGSHTMLSWSQLAEISSAGIEIGAHTRRHRDLRKLSKTEARVEIGGSRLEIEDHLGRSVESFAYPYGHVSPLSLEIVRQEFRAACTTVLRRASGESFHELPRVDVYYLRTRAQLLRLLDGRLDYYLTVRRVGRLVRGAWPIRPIEIGGS